MPLDHFEKAQIIARIERLQALLHQLEHVTASGQIQLRERARRELDATKQTLQTYRRGDG